MYTGYALVPVKCEEGKLKYFIIISVGQLKVVLAIFKVLILI